MLIFAVTTASSMAAMSLSATALFSSDDVIELHAACRPGRGQLLVEQLDGFGFLVALVQLKDGGMDSFELFVPLFEGRELDLVFLRGDGGAMVGQSAPAGEFRKS